MSNRMTPVSSRSGPVSRTGRSSSSVTVDLVVLAVRDGDLSALLVRRGESPFAGRWALPGDFVRDSECLSEAASRELATIVGEDEPVTHLEQLASYGDPNRDPRGRVVSVAYLAIVSSTRTGRDRELSGASWRSVSQFLDETGNTPAAGDLAFDHAQILGDGVERARAKLEYSALAAAFCPAEFTVGELRRVYEAVWGATLDPRNFHRKITGTRDLLVPVGAVTSRQGGRPAQLFRQGRAVLLNPPIPRPQR